MNQARNIQVGYLKSVWKGIDEMFVFSLYTKANLNQVNSLFDQSGNYIGRVLSKSPTFKDDYEEFEYNGNYHYEIDSTKEIFKNLECGEIQLNLKEYSVSLSNIHWVRGE